MGESEHVRIINGIGCGIGLWDGGFARGLVAKIKSGALYYGGRADDCWVVVQLQPGCLAGHLLRFLLPWFSGSQNVRPGCENGAVGSL